MVRRKNEFVRPFLKWAGGKGQILPQLKMYLPQISNTYFEPFIGAGALFLNLQNKKCVIGDTNEELLNCYQVLRDNVEELIQALEIHKQKNTEEYFYQIRLMDRDNGFKFMSDVERAARIIFLNKTCFNGLFRVNAQGQFNVPYGRYTNPNICDSVVLRAVASYLVGNDIQIIHGDFETTLSQATKNDFIYFDPPYDPVSSTASFTGYDVNGFGKNEQLRLKQYFDELHRRECKVMLSNAATDFIRNLYQDYNQVIISANRAINSKADRRGAVDEILVTNYPYPQK
ncbi:MAG: DNA adenine methylase [Anaerolineae bacterium]|nr:DNA adenine methylase [Gloeobacterales cyanobacterium ES-bin-313]